MGGAIGGKIGSAAGRWFGLELEEMSYEDVARVVGCPLGTVRSRLHHARRGLRRAIERMNGHE